MNIAWAYVYRVASGLDIANGNASSSACVASFKG